MIENRNLTLKSSVILTPEKLLSNRRGGTGSMGTVPIEPVSQIKNEKDCNSNRFIASDRRDDVGFSK